MILAHIWLISNMDVGHRISKLSLTAQIVRSPQPRSMSINHGTLNWYLILWVTLYHLSSNEIKIIFVTEQFNQPDIVPVQKWKLLTELLQAYGLPLSTQRKLPDSCFHMISFKVKHHVQHTLKLILQ